MELEHGTSNARVAGSNPAGGAIKNKQKGLTNMDRKEELKDLEQAVLNIASKIKELPNYTMVAKDLQMIELKQTITRCSEFIDFAKFEFGEDIIE